MYDIEMMESFKTPLQILLHYTDIVDLNLNTFLHCKLYAIFVYQEIK
jgi:hypothetical protein